MSSPKIRSFMILTYININPELLIKLIASKLTIRAEAHP